jgi:SAM-dependent methyltransferase
MTALGRLLQSLQSNGVRGAARVFAEGIGWRAERVRKWLMLQGPLRLRRIADANFDRKYGVETSGPVSAFKLDIPDGKVAGIHHYEPTPAPAIRAMLKAVPIQHEQFTFVDYGSGKGRVLLLAADYPYKRIIGVEFSQKLHDVATRNLGIWKSPSQRCFQVESVCEDARQFVLPDGPIVLFFFTPFRSPVSDQVIANIRQSLVAQPRPIRIIHYGESKDFRKLLSTLGLASETIYSDRPFAAEAKYIGTMYSSKP